MNNPVKFFRNLFKGHGCRTGFATPSETFAGGDPENIPDGVANPVRQNQS
ncbi:Uncharacterized protein dnm_088180 [Desulfonema magnum]|uniref:Uncharacterized protein n=1 Tax=Desulfonema magnum TaxID=45655 RepID=A0A975GT55_9BACT|nr:Uncharacterized protein dnm_088180 [Desulfonema magnum]